MNIHCQICGAAISRSLLDWQVCSFDVCDACYEEWDRNHELAAAGHLDWNMSLHDPWWRTWLASTELYSTIRQHLPGIATQRGHLLGGELYDFDSQHSCHVEAWISPDAIIVAYPLAVGTSIMKPCTISEFHRWIDALYNAEPLEPGRIQFSPNGGSSSYGARRPEEIGFKPTVMWAQAGDWASMFRNWYFAGSPNVPGF